MILAPPNQLLQENAEIAEEGAEISARFASSCKIRDRGRCGFAALGRLTT